MFSTHHFSQKRKRIVSICLKSFDSCIYEMVCNFATTIVINTMCNTIVKDRVVIQININCCQCICHAFQPIKIKRMSETFIGIRCSPKPFYGIDNPFIKSTIQCNDLSCTNTLG